MSKVTYITSLLPPSINGPNCDRHTWGVVQTVTLIFPKAFIFLVPSQRSISLYSCPLFCVRPFLLFYIFLTCCRCSNQVSLTFCFYAPLLPHYSQKLGLVFECLLPEEQWMVTGTTDLLLHQLLNGLLEDFFLENFLLLLNTYKVSSIFWPTLIPIIGISYLSL